MAPVEYLATPSAKKMEGFTFSSLFFFGPQAESGLQIRHLKFQSSKFEFPRVRTYEMIGLVLGCTIPARVPERAPLVELVLTVTIMRRARSVPPINITQP